MKKVTYTSMLTKNLFGKAMIICWIIILVIVELTEYVPTLEQLLLIPFAVLSYMSIVFCAKTQRTKRTKTKNITIATRRKTSSRRD